MKNVQERMKMKISSALFVATSVGCPNCEFIEDCNPQAVSSLCICKKCEQLEDPFISYKKALVEKFPVLNIKI